MILRIILGDCWRGSEEVQECWGNVEDNDEGTLECW